LPASTAAAWSRDLGCVINNQGIQTCVAMGWQNETFPVNAVMSRRKRMDEAAVFVRYQC